MKIKRGTTILEVIIAAAMISFAVIASLSLTSKSQSQSDYARRTAAASKYGSELADWIRGQRDNSGFAELAAITGTFCATTLPTNLTDLSTLPSTCSSLIENVYTRTITLSSNANTITVAITVSWQDQATRSHTINLELTKW